MNAVVTSTYHAKLALLETVLLSREVLPEDRRELVLRGALCLVNELERSIKARLWCNQTVLLSNVDALRSEIEIRLNERNSWVNPTTVSECCAELQSVAV